MRTDPPYLVYDNLGQNKRPLRRDETRAIVRAILERKYAGSCSPEYVDMVVKSIKDDPVQLRAPRYVRAEEKINSKSGRSSSVSR